ncbi:MAG: elongation factor 4 [Candidatus Wildermuthbacteria bacterium]|nr:elongation factor 4 [Candidatus Wildermuthbacteria bacterium]
MGNNIRNFCIISHVDHGKSTLADRFLELTGTVEKRKMREQFLDQMDLEREKGITIKMQPVRMLWHPGGPERSEGREIVLNLIDTPGHADFSYEVSRSLAAVEGAVLLVDATKGVQAQTLAHLSHAKNQGLFIIPCINKIDSPLARIEETAREIEKLLSVDSRDIFRISAKEGTGVKELLDAIIQKVPSPKGEEAKPFRAVIFDSRFDAFKGIVAFVRVVDGTLLPNERFTLLGTQAEGVVKEVGYFSPKEVSQSTLHSGEIGYVATGIKEPEKVRIGDTIAKSKNLEALPGFQIPKPVVFVSLYPQDPNEFDALKDALSKLKLSDPSFTYDVEAKEALGRGFRCGFLGVLHSEIITERIQREYKIEMVVSRPSVEFSILSNKGEILSVKTPSDWPSPNVIQSMEEPWAQVEVIVPGNFLSQVLQFLRGYEGNQLGVDDLGEEKFLIRNEMPLRELIGDFHDKLKSVTQGMASMDYQIGSMRKANLVKLEFRIAGETEEALSMVVPDSRAYQEGKKVVEKLKEVLPPQLFEVALQAVVGSKVLARETINARRRDVTAPLYGGDYTRKKKLLEIQKKGKKELKEKGRVTIPTHVFLDVFRT